MPAIAECRTPARRQRGFTLIELLTVMTIIGIMMGFGIPAFRNFVGGQRVKSAATELMSSVLIARSEAVKRNGTVTITPSSTSAWGNGWAVSAGATTLQQQESLSNIVVTSYSDVACGTPATVGSIAFSNSGRAASSSCFKFASSGATTTRCVKIDLSGIPSAGNCP